MFSPKSLGYDRGHIYSPDGRLYQVEYANEAVRRGSSCLGLIGSDGVALITQKKSEQEHLKLATQEGKEKIFALEDHIILTGSGLLGDLQWLVSYARIQTQNLKLTYGEPAGIQLLVKKIASLLLYHTQISGFRPFGVSLLITGINLNKKILFKIEPSGSYFSYNGVAIGERTKELTEYLEQHYNTEQLLSDQIKMGLKAFKEQNPELKSSQIEIVKINQETSINYQKLSNKEISDLFNDL
ncbi:MAG: archaeal proteasome endopeptidase complex subunit alpha [Candidatus Hodarchaeales archaeon]|jgi:proteasome alpha subunit